MLELLTQVMFGIVVFSLVVWPLVTYAQDAAMFIARAVKKGGQR